mmetsp:Transcript_118248/g.232166  ORF Transcript_118248/g.232166 Transcript_118248/m.232166 type:complete len:412 (-) Transcript_118248:35-1270(-)
MPTRPPRAAARRPGRLKSLRPCGAENVGSRSHEVLVGRECDGSLDLVAAQVPQNFARGVLGVAIIDESAEQLLRASLVCEDDVSGADRHGSGCLGPFLPAQVDVFGRLHEEFRAICELLGHLLDLFLRELADVVIVEIDQLPLVIRPVVADLGASELLAVARRDGHAALLRVRAAEGQCHQRFIPFLVVVSPPKISHFKAPAAEPFLHLLCGNDLVEEQPCNERREPTQVKQVLDPPRVLQLFDFQCVGPDHRTAGLLLLLAPLLLALILLRPRHGHPGCCCLRLRRHHMIGAGGRVSAEVVSALHERLGFHNLDLFVFHLEGVARHNEPLPDLLVDGLQNGCPICRPKPLLPLLLVLDQQFTHILVHEVATFRQSLPHLHELIQVGRSHLDRRHVERALTTGSGRRTRRN